MARSMASAGEAAGGPIPSLLNPSDIHVLLVDDERLTRLVVGNLLRTCKYRVTIAESGAQALEVLSKAGPGAFQLILTDVMMPDVGGLELLRFVRSHQHLYNVPVIMMSASEAQETMCAALLGSADEYLVKPVTRKEVQNIWMHVMKRYHHGAAAQQPAAVLEAPPDSTAAPAPAPLAAAGTATGGSCALGGLIPLASSTAAAAAAVTNLAMGGGCPVFTACGSGLPSRRGPLLSSGMGLGGALGLPPEVARDMMRAAALAASTTAAAGPGATGPHRVPPRLLAGEEGQNLAAWLLDTDAAAAALPGPLSGVAGPPDLTSAEAKGIEAAAASGGDGGGGGGRPFPSHPTTLQDPSRQPHHHNGGPQHTQPHAGSLGHGTTGTGGGGCGGGRGHGASKVNLLKWLRRANRSVQPKESFWIFCEVLLLLDSCQAAATAGCSRACALRPSRLVLYSNGRVAFTPPPPLPPSAAAAAATAMEAAGAAGEKGGGGAGGGGSGGARDGSGGSMEGRKRRRGYSSGRLRSAEVEMEVVKVHLTCGAAAAAATAGSGDGGGGGGIAGDGGCTAGRGHSLQGVVVAVDGAASQERPPALLQDGAAAPAPAVAAAAAAASVVEVAAAAAAAATGSSDGDEDALYCSPEEALGQPATPASDMFSLGLLFFELFYVCAGHERAALLRDARQRVLPASFTRQQPKEAAFALALLHPEPSCRPTLAELLGSAMFRATCASLRRKAQQRPGAGAGAGAGAAASEYGREHPPQQHVHSHHHHRHTNHNRQHSLQVHRTAAAAAAVANGGWRAGGHDAKLQQQQQALAAQQMMNGSGGARGRGSAGGVTAAPAAAGAAALDPVAAAAETAAAAASSGTGLRVDDAVLLEFLHTLRKRKLEELAQVDSELAFFTADAQMVEQYLLYLHQTRSVKRQRGGGCATGSNAAPKVATAAASSAMPPPPPLLSPCHTQAQTQAQGQRKDALGDGLGLALHAAESAEKKEVEGAAAGGGGGGGGDGGNEGLRLTTVAATAAAATGAPGSDAAAAVASRAPLGTPLFSAAWSEQHQAAQSKWCRIANKYELLEGVFLERCRPSPPAAAPKQAGGFLEQPLPAAAAAPPPPPSGKLGGLAVAVSASSFRSGATATAAAARRHADAGGLAEPLLRFAEDLAAFATFTTLTPVASLRYGDPPTTSSMVAGAAFDRDDEFFAVAGVSKRIKIYEREAVLQSNIGMHYPVLEISSRSRLSSLTWSSYIKGHLASADYEGVVQLWDANTNSELMQFEEHRKRVWSIDFSQADPARLLSGGDDGLVKLWSIQQEAATATIDLRANVCSVQFNPTSPHLLAAGCANYRIFLYDVRNTSRALHVLPGHTRAVSYVRFLSPTQLVSASTDNTLRLWQLDGLCKGTGTSVSASGAAAAAAAGDSAAAGGSCVQVFRGHTNERNFTGLSVSSDGYISCGSENNRVFCYYQNLPMPVTYYDFSAADADARGGGGNGDIGGGGGGGGGGSGAEGAAGPAVGGGVGSTAGSGIGAGVDCSGMGPLGLSSTPGSGQFVSSVCWSRRSNLLLAANSVGYIKLFTLH